MSVLEVAITSVRTDLGAQFRPRVCRSHEYGVLGAREVAQVVPYVVVTEAKNSNADFGHYDGDSCGAAIAARICSSKLRTVGWLSKEVSRFNRIPATRRTRSRRPAFAAVARAWPRSRLDCSGSPCRAWTAAMSACNAMRLDTESGLMRSSTGTSVRMDWLYSPSSCSQLPRNARYMSESQCWKIPSGIALTPIRAVSADSSRV